MYSHLITIKVSIVSCTNTRMKLNSSTFNKHWIECLNTQLVQGRCTVQQHWMIFGYFFQHIKHFRRTLFNKSFCTFDIRSQISDNDFSQYKWFEHFECHFFWNTTLGERKLWTNNDN